MAAAVEHLSELVVGRHPGDIEDITRMVHLSGYWRNGPVLNNALSGLDMALWDILGKRLGVPVYELLGGRVRGAVPLYLHASGATIDETIAYARALMDEGYRYIRLQTGGPRAVGHPGPPAGRCDRSTMITSPGLS